MKITVQGGPNGTTVAATLSAKQVADAVAVAVGRTNGLSEGSVKLDEVFRAEARGGLLLPVFHFEGRADGRAPPKPADDNCKLLEPLREADVVAIVEKVLKRVSSEDPLYRERPYTPRLWSHTEVVDAVRSALVASGVVAGEQSEQVVEMVATEPVPASTAKQWFGDSGPVSSRDAKLAGLGSPEAAERLREAILRRIAAEEAHRAFSAYATVAWGGSPYHADRLSPAEVSEVAARTAGIAAVADRDGRLAGLGSPEAELRLRVAAEASRDDVVKYLRGKLDAAESTVTDYGLRLKALAHEVRRRETTEERLEALQGINQNLEARVEALALRLVEEQSRWEESQDKLQDAREVISAHEEREHQLERRAEAAEKLAAERAAANDDLGHSLADAQTKLLDARRRLDREAEVHVAAEMDLMWKVNTEKKRADEAEQQAQASRNVSIALRQRAEAAEAAEAKLECVKDQWRQLLLEKAPQAGATLSPDAAQVARDNLVETIALVMCNLPVTQKDDLRSGVKALRQATGRDTVSGR